MMPNDRYLDFIDTAYDVSESPERFDDLLTIATRYLFAEDDGTQIASDLPRYAGIDALKFDCPFLLC